MPQDNEGNIRVRDLSSGLYRRTSDRLIGEGHAADISNVQLDKLVVEEAKGWKRLNSRLPERGGVRITPPIRRPSAEATEYREGFVFVPLQVPASAAWTHFECHFRIEEEVLFPESGPSDAARAHGGLTGRYGIQDGGLQHVLGAHRIGGEHQAFILAAEGVREQEFPRWGIGIGCIRPEGLVDATGVDISESDRIVPIFYSLDLATQRLIVSACNFDIFPKQDYHVCVDLDNNQWFVNGVLKAPMGGSDGVQPLTNHSVAAQDSALYFGRGFMREPNVEYNTARNYDWKHLYGGKWGLVAGVPAGANIPINSQQMASVVATASSYIGYRLRMTSGTDKGKLHVIVGSINPTVDATFQVTVQNAAHGIGAGDTCDIVPMVEPISLDVTMQEFRRWNSTSLTNTMIGAMGNKKMFSNILDDEPFKNPAASSETGNSPVSDLQNYWPMDEDGGLVVKDLVGNQDGYFGPSLVSINEANPGPSGRRSMWLDGETHALRVELDKDPNFKRNMIFNLGHKVQDDHHWNFCARLSFCLGAQDTFSTSGNIETHTYQTLVSIGDPGGTAPVFEVRVSRHGGAAQRVYFICPDGTIVTLSSFDLEEGRWYNAVVGIEALRQDSTKAQDHHVYFHAVDANLFPVGEISAPFALDQRPIDAGKESQLLFGASVVGQATLGSRGKNHAMMGISVLGWGFHPAHVVPEDATPVVNPSMTVQHLSPFLPFNQIDLLESVRPPVIGPGGGVKVTGSAQLTNLNSEDFDISLRRWPLFIGALEIVERRIGEVPLIFPDNLVVRAVAADVLHTIRPIGSLGVEEGPEVRVQVWAGYTMFKTPEPAWDLDLNTGRNEGEVWAVTPNLFNDLVGGTDSINLALDAHYEFLSPWRWAPYWFQGVVTDLAVEIKALRQYKTADGQSTIAAVVGGSLYEWRNRWVRDHPFDDTSYCFEFQRIAEGERARLEVLREGAYLYGSGSRIPPAEAISVLGGLGTGAVGDTSVADQYHVIESFIKMPDLQGRRTISSYQEVDIEIFGGSQHQYNFKKNHVFQLVDGDLWVEIGVSSGQAMRARTSGKPIITTGQWHHVKAVITFVADTLTSVQFYIDGLSVPTNVASVGPAITKASIPKPAQGKLWLGASGGQVDPTAKASGYPLVDGLGGRMAGWGSYTSASLPAGGVPQRILNASPHLRIAMDDNDGVKLNSSVEATFPGAYTWPRFEGNELVHVGSGMGWDRLGRVVMEIFGDILYITNKITRPWLWDRQHFTPAGLRSPSVKPGTLTISREPMRVSNKDSDYPAIIDTDLLEVGAGPSELRNFAPWQTFSQKDIGGVVYVPPHPIQGGAGDGAYGLIDVISGVDTATPAINLLTITDVIHYSGGVTDIPYMIFKKSAAASPASLRAAMQELTQVNTPWGANRLVCDGKAKSLAPTRENRTTVILNTACMQFKGQSYVEVNAFQNSVMIARTAKVLEVKCYLRVDDGVEFGDAEQVLCEYALDGDSGLFRIVFFDGGRLRFEFFDSALGEFRSIQTVGSVITANQWYYLDFSYRFKASGSHFGDTEGGWEPDLRWTRKGVAGTHFAKTRDFRDSLIIVACEGLWQNNESGSLGDVDDAHACSLLTLPGCQSPLSSNVASGATAETHNHSQKLMNSGLMRDNPYLTPEHGDSLYPPAAGWPASPPKSGIELTMLVATIGPLTATPGAMPANFQLPVGFCLPRQCSMNRDNAWSRVGPADPTTTNQICLDNTGGFQNFYNQNTVAWPTDDAGRTATLASPALGITGQAGTYGRKSAYAVLVRLYTITTAGGSGLPVGTALDTAPGDPARVLVLVHLGTNDLDNSSRGGVSGHTVFLTDDPVFGGDGLGNLQVAEADVKGAGIKFFCTIELQNGLNQSVNSTNRLVCPSLLEHGTNPVGVGDSPDETVAPFRVGGTVEQGQEGRIRRGLRGMIDDFAFSYAALSSHATNVYTPDLMPPDAFFHGPADTRIQSLPPIRPKYNVLVLDDVAGTALTNAALFLNFDVRAGRDVPNDATYGDAMVPGGQIVTQGLGIEPQGEHRIRVRFRDPDQNVRSNPSEELLIRVEGQDGTGAFLEAAATFLLKGIPVSGDRYRRRLWRDIFRTLPDSGLPLLWATIKDNTTVTFKRRSELAELIVGETLEFDNARPPICGVMVPSETNLFFADVDDAPNIVVFSKPFEASQVPGTNLISVESSKGGSVVGLGFLKGLVVPVKENAVFVVQPSGSRMRSYRIGQAVGCLSHNSFSDYHTSLWFLTQTGVSSFRGNQTVQDQSLIIERFIRDSLDIMGSRKSWGATYLSRDQYMCSIQELGDDEPMTLLTGVQRWDEFGNPYMAWSLIRPGVPVHSMCEWQNDPADMNRVVVGSRGVLFEHDKGPGIGVKTEGLATGSLQGLLKSATAQSVTFDNLSSIGGGTINSFKDEMVGIPILIIADYLSDGTLATLTQQGSRFSVIHQSTSIKVDLAGADGKAWFDRLADIGLFGVGLKVILGGVAWLWESKWFDQGLPEDTTNWHFLDLYFKPVASAFGVYAYFEILANYDEETVGVYGAFPLADGSYQIPLADVKANAIKVRVKGWGFNKGFELSDLALRADPATVGQKQP